MKWTKEFKKKLITLIITLTISTSGTAGIIFSCSGEVKRNGEKTGNYITEIDTIENNNTSVNGL